MEDRSDLVGYRVVVFGKLNGVDIPYPFFKLSRVDRNYTDVMVLMVMAPLYLTEIKTYWEIVRHGYMPIGMMSYMSYPKYEIREA